MNGRPAHHLLTALLLLPAIIVSIAWALAPVRMPRSIVLNVPSSSVTTWRWRLGYHTIIFERIEPDAPFSMLPKTRLFAAITPPAGGMVMISGRRYRDPFGWITRNDGFYLLGHQVRPVRQWSFALILPLLATLPFAWLGVRRLRRPSFLEQRRQAGLC